MKRLMGYGATALLILHFSALGAHRSQRVAQQFSELPPPTQMTIHAGSLQSPAPSALQTAQCKHQQTSRHLGRFMSNPAALALAIPHRNPNSIFSQDVALRAYLPDSLLHPPA